jgi:hypothetical protein
MLKTPRSVSTLVSAVAIASWVVSPLANAASTGGGKKLLVYILAGQSNMQGHAEVSTLAYLVKPAYVPTPEEWAMLTSWLNRDIRVKAEPTISAELLKDPANAKLPKKEFGELLKKAVEAEVAKA